jgi:UPF0042 nucleotide-binding protein
VKPKTELLIVTGLSGAGKHQLLYQLEDLGYFCVDNLPAPLIPQGIRFLRQEDKRIVRLAIGIDVRTRLFLQDLKEALLALKKEGRPYKIIFLEAAENELVRRFVETRRPHPVQGKKTLGERIRCEASQLSWLRDQADMIIDTTRLTPPELRRQLSEWLDWGQMKAHITVSSFGFKYGLPDDADFIFDVRFLPNTFYIPKLKKMNGTYRPVQQYILKQPLARQAIDEIQGLIQHLVPHFLREGKAMLHIAIGCTGGQHRSVVVAEELARRLAGNVTLVHRELAVRAGEVYE